MDDRRTINADRRRSEAFKALAHPVDEGRTGGSSERESAPIEIHDGEEFDDSPPAEDILEGLDRVGLDPRLEQRSIA